MRTVYIYLYKDQKNCNKKKAQLIVWKIWCLKSHSLLCSWSFLYEIGKYACNVLVLFFFNWLILIFRSNLFFFNNLFISFPCLGSFFSVVWSGYIKKNSELKAGQSQTVQQCSVQSSSVTNTLTNHSVSRCDFEKVSFRGIMLWRKLMLQWTMSWIWSFITML